MIKKIVFIILLLLSVNALADTPKKFVITDEKKAEMKVKAKIHRKKFLEERKKKLEKEIDNINSALANIDK